MSQRPELSKDIDAATFREYYYLKEELYIRCLILAYRFTNGKLECIILIYKKRWRDYAFKNR